MEKTFAKKTDWEANQKGTKPVIIKFTINKDSLRWVYRLENFKSLRLVAANGSCFFFAKTDFRKLVGENSFIQPSENFSYSEKAEKKFSGFIGFKGLKDSETLFPLSELAQQIEETGGEQFLEKLVWYEDHNEIIEFDYDAKTGEFFAKKGWIEI